MLYIMVGFQVTLVASTTSLAKQPYAGLPPLYNALYNVCVLYMHFRFFMSQLYFCETDCRKNTLFWIY